ncbi:MAG: GatB/YqeY domain-containing protein [Patescibacteria group bacterium]
MNLLERVDNDLKQAMKSKNESELSILRLIRAGFKNKQIDLGHELTNDEAEAVIKTMVKQGKDALVDFETAGRQDLIEKQLIELKFLETFLPPPMSEEELRNLCNQAIQESGAQTQKDMGKAIGLVMKKAGGRADGNSVKTILTELLA